MRSLASFLIGIFLVSSLRAEEKFSMATTPGKLPKDVIPRAYFIHLEPNTEERRMYLRALSAVRDPELARRSVEFFISKHVAPGDAGRALEEEALEHPEIVWTYATTHLKQMQQRFGFFRWNRLLPNIATGFTDSERADELVRFAQQNLPAQGQREADNAANLIRSSAELKKRELPKIDRWVATKIAQGDAHGQSN
jgi:hypothetical protein